MEDIVAEEVFPSDPPEVRQLQRKEIEHALEPENNGTLDCQEMRIPDGSRQGFLEMFASHDNQGRVQTKQNLWRNLHQQAGGSGSESSQVNNIFKDNGQVMSNVLENGGSTSFSEFLSQRENVNNQYEGLEELTNTEAGMQTKMLSKSGSEIYVKNTLKGKGVIYKGPHHESCLVEFRNARSSKVTSAFLPTSNPNVSMDANIVMPSSIGVNAGTRYNDSDCDEISLREWLKIGRPKANKLECLHIFREIVNLVDHFHLQGVAMHGLRPSFFKLLPSNEVKYVGASVQREIVESITDQDASYSENISIRKMPVEQEISFVGLWAKKQKISQTTRSQWPQFSTPSYFDSETLNTSPINITGPQNISGAFYERNPGKKNGTCSKSSSLHMHNAAQQLTSISEQLEEKWYISPEERTERSYTILSNIYNLGVLLFELLAQFDSNRALDVAMSNLRHRILPPSFLSENAMEAGFCLWLLHPEPSSRPTTREILRSEVVNGLPEADVKELVSSMDQEDADSELLLQFLTSLREQKEKEAAKLMETIQLLEADVDKVERRHCSRKPLIDGGLYNEYLNGRKDTFVGKEESRSEAHSPFSPVSSSNESGLMRNINQLESAYFLMRSRVQLTETDSTIRTDRDLLKNRNNSYVVPKGEENETANDRLGAIFEGLCRYARYSRFEVRGKLRNGDFNCSSNIICSLSFDRDEEYFAAAGVAKKIKIFEFNAIFNDSVDIHYPVIEMSNKSRISCVSWNNYIKNYLASTDYDGAVKLWDASTGQEFAQYTEHERRAWSVDFSQVYPTKLASGSDDGSVKLWSINEKNCLDTIRNNANVCCVQFSAHSTHLLAFGTADYKTYCYDLRNTSTPWCILGGHEKAVSYVKFLDSETLVSASTDNTLKLWDLNKTRISGPSNNACSLTLCGHTNEKNFVGLSISDGYIACGSETNEVYAYYRSLPTPITSYKFGSTDPISGNETDVDNKQFVSSVCWKGKSDMVVAANSSGCIKVLQIV